MSVLCRCMVHFVILFFTRFFLSAVLIMHLFYLYQGVYAVAVLFTPMACERNRFDQVKERGAKLVGKRMDKFNMRFVCLQVGFFNISG
jgi:hypothetical protein